MNDSRKKPVRTERPKIRRVYVSLVNPDDPNDREHFTAYETSVEELKRRVVGERRQAEAAAVA